jgi:hypothetical protein
MHTPAAPHLLDLADHLRIQLFPAAAEMPQPTPSLITGSNT